MLRYIAKNSVRDLFLTTLWRMRKAGLLSHKGDWKPDDETFFTWHKRPRRASQIPVPRQIEGSSLTAVVIQGPISTSDDFTLETVCILKKFNPETPVIVSTWEGQPVAVIESLKKVGAQVIESKKPMLSGPANINLQLVSTFAGIEKAHEIGAEYILKIRSDVRIYEPNYLNFLQEMLSVFPLDLAHAGQIQRIIAISEDTFLNRIYAVGDFVMFGSAEDMTNYWSQAPVESNSFELEDFLEATPETFLCANFLRKIGVRPTDSPVEWEAVLRDRFVVLDASSLDLLWRKYSNREYFFKTYSPDDPLQPLTFAGWLALRI